MGLTWNRRVNLTPAIIAALLLHLGVFLAVTLLDRRPWMLPVGSAVPIELVSHGPPQTAPKAEIAPQTQQAAAETPEPPTPQTIPAPPPAAPAPAPAKAEAAPPPVPKPAPTPRRPEPTPQPSARPQPTAKAVPPTRAFSLDALAASIAKASHSAPAKPSAVAARGPDRPQTAPQPAAVAEAAQGPTQSDMEGLQQLLGRLWNPNCAVEGAGSVVIPVKFLVGPSGRIIGRVAAGEAASPDPVVAAAARRAIDAVHEAEPFPEVYRNNPFTVNFDARKYCSER